MFTSSASKVLNAGDHGEFDNAGAGVASVIRLDNHQYAFYEGRDTEGDLPENGQAAFKGMYAVSVSPNRPTTELPGPKKAKSSKALNPKTGRIGPVKVYAASAHPPR